jgi:hypothetical protein
VTAATELSAGAYAVVVVLPRLSVAVTIRPNASYVLSLTVCNTVPPVAVHDFNASVRLGSP